MNTLLVTSTADGTGKTAITIALAQYAKRNGVDVGYMKPKGTRLESVVGKTRDEDPMLARELLDIDAEMHQLEPVVYSPTFIQEAIRGREDPEDLQRRITDNFEELSAEKDLMLLEGGGPHWTGSIVDLADGDIAELLDAQVLLVTPFDRAGDVDSILAAAEDLGDRLAGVLFNAVGSAEFVTLTDDVMPFLDGRGIDSVGAIPHDEQLAGVTVAELADSIGADLLTADAPTDGFVERFSVGAMGSNAALKQFRRLRNSAVITGGDRSEIQTTALEASGVQCLILTGGYRPPAAVLGKAEDRGIPVILVRSDTRTTIDRIEEVRHSGRTRDAAVIDVMQGLLTDSVDVDSLLELDE